eukprot:gene499-272_t
MSVYRNSQFNLEEEFGGIHEAFDEALGEIECAKKKLKEHDEALLACGDAWVWGLAEKIERLGSHESRVVVNVRGPTRGLRRRIPPLCLRRLKTQNQRQRQHRRKSRHR